jgi:hypothetical protein
MLQGTRGRDSMVGHSIGRFLCVIVDILFVLCTIQIHYCGGAVL